ncbi:MAG: TMEM165/GDT1 family protein [Actinobacteria bacterium]|nr:TMEM165/GDT1 family protein [Actinomycetota bacterium]
MWSAFFLSFGIIFVAELGDKSQLMAMAFAARYKALPVLLGISIATAVTHALSVGLGSVVGDQMPTASISIVAGVAFLGFAGWTLRGDTLNDDEVQAAQKNTRNAVVAASVAFFLAELGDKTMLATITLATDHDAFGTWVGSTLGMVSADALAILVGYHLGSRLPERTIRIGAAVLFLIFGLILIFQGI